MGKIDEVKEILNTLRVTMSLAFGVFILIIGKVVSLYSEQDFTDIFWISIVASLLDLMIIVLIVRKIASKTKEIREL